MDGVGCLANGTKKEFSEDVKFGITVALEKKGRTVLLTMD